ncbi:MAG TPA: aminoglycoside phosphotransferase family protein [Caulobacteraceae bacterium]|jgi:Ser/Thr protein kinase RdoA (MazF antagonist)|nr:aminoglycoside phosphotransferase family protein [Caulobacteraceae bacterium]
MSGGAPSLNLALAAAITARLDPPFSPEALRRFEGASTEVVEITGQGHAAILKLYADEPAWKLPKEAFVARLYAEQDTVPTPRWLLTDESRRLLPRRFVVMTRLPGQSLRARFGAPGDDALFREMGELLLRLHATPMPRFGYLLAGDLATPFETNTAWMAASFETKFREFRGWGGDAALGGRLEGFFGQRSAALAECATPVLCHNDFHPGNVLADQDPCGAWRISGLVDFENAVAADPLFDLAKVLDYTAHECAAGRAPLAEGYGALDRPGAHEALELYRVFHKLELLNWFKAVRADPLGPATASLLADLAEIVGS